MKQVKEVIELRGLKQFISESKENDLMQVQGTPKLDGLSPTVHNFLHHLTASSFGLTDAEMNDHARAILGENEIILEKETPSSDKFSPSAIRKRGDDLEASRQSEHEAAQKEKVAKGEHPEQYKNVRSRMKDGFHAAFPENEHPDVTKQKAKESVAHFRKYMHEEGGHAENNKLTMMGQNGKTASSTGAGRNTIGLSITPAGGHRSGKKAEKGQFDSCPNSTEECRKNCLGYQAGGNRQYADAADKAKELRSRYLREHPEHAARVLSHEIGENEKFASEHNTVHDKSNNIIGYKNKKTGKIKSESKEHTPETIKAGLDSGDHHEKPIESGARLNVTSDLHYHRMMPKKFFEKHKNTKFYDYTKNHGTLDDEKPDNYTHGLSHTGDNHAESNSHEAIKHLQKGGIVAMVYQRGKDKPKAHTVRAHHADGTTSDHKVVDGDNDDNLDTRHEAAAQEHDALAAHHHEQSASAASKEIADAHHKEKEKHQQIASEYRAKKRGVVSGLALKGVTNESAGHFANKVDEHGVIHIHDHGPQSKLRRTIPISSK